MENTAQDELLRQISDAVRTCGEIMLHADRSKNCIDEKAGHANFVTDYDKKVQQELQKRLLEILPEGIKIIQGKSKHNKKRFPIPGAFLQHVFGDLIPLIC